MAATKRSFSSRAGRLTIGRRLTTCPTLCHPPSRKPYGRITVAHHPPPNSASALKLTITMAISRRDLLKTAAAVATGPTLLLGSKAVTLGSGDHTYEFVGDWG